MGEPPSTDTVRVPGEVPTPDSTTPDGTTPDGATPDGATPDGATPDVVAAGVLCWRATRDGRGVEVLIVHRPAYDDWSWPKGKPERREDLPECAVREAAEETGAQVRLGRPLPPVRYPLPDGSVKEVTYWAARVAGPAAAASRKAAAKRQGGREVDDVRWVPLAGAQARLSHAADAVPLAALREYAAAGTLATAATLVVRHATARPRDSWARADADRPLVASGRRQAMALGALLQCWHPDLVVASPWRRCLETVDPYIVASGARLRTKGGLSEAGHRRSPAKAGKHLRALLESTHGGALCTHRPVLGDVLAAVRDWCPPDVADAVPRSNPFLRAGELLVAHAVHGRGRHPVVVAVERHGTR